MAVKAIIIYKDMKKFFNSYICPAVILILSIFGMKAFFHPGLFTAHDIWHQVVRLQYYWQAVNDGQFPPYWIGQLANSFGYPLFVFSYHLPWILGTSLLSIGLDIPNTLKTLFFLSYISSGLTMYFFIKNLLRNRLAALLSSILYLWLPYHFLIIFVGGSIGIAFVFTFLPLIFLGIQRIKEESRFGIPILALGLSGVTLSHIMHLIFLSPIILLFLVWGLTNTNRRGVFLKNIGLGIILSLLISSFYLIPAFYYNQFTRVHQETGFYEVYKRNFINFNQLIYSKWGFSPIVNNAKNGEISFQLGFAQWISILSLLLLIIFNKLSKENKTLSAYLLISFIVSILLMLDISKAIWAFLVKFTTIDFPFRLILPATFIASISAGIIVANIKNRLQILIFILLIIIAIYTNRNHININQYTNFPISTYLKLETEITTNTFNEYLPLQASGKLLNKPWDAIVGENIVSSNVSQKTNILSFDLNVKKEGIFSIGQFYFPGQYLYLNDKKIKLNYDKDGRIIFTAPQGKYKVKVKYQEPLLIKISKGLTVIGILLMLFVLLTDIKLFKQKFHF